MIVPTMTLQEIHKEVFEDLKTLSNKLDEFKNEFKKMVLKRNRYPFTKSFDCITQKRKNLFIVEFTALKRSA